MPLDGPLVVANGGFCVFHWLIQGQDAYNVLGLHLGAGITVDVAMANAVATCASDAFTTAAYVTNLSANSSLEGVAVRDLRTANMPEYAGVFTRKTGSDAGEPIPGSTAICITLRTALAGKSYRGRVFVPSDAIGAWDGASHAYTTTAMDKADNFITMFNNALSASAPLGGNVRLAVIGRRRHETLPPVANIVTQIVGRSPMATTQRRRLPRRG